MIVPFCVLLITAAWLYVRRVYSYWERKGFPFMKPSIPVGNLQAVSNGQRSFGVAIYDLYTSSKEKFVGIYLLFRPALLVRDAQLARDILTKDFNSFHDRGIYTDENDPISAHLFALQGQAWRKLRAQLTPAFSSGKLKTMFTTIRETGEKMQNHLAEKIPDGGMVVELKDFMLRYTNDIIGSVIFGLDINSFQNPENEFRMIEKEINKRGFLAAFRQIGSFLVPKLISILPVSWRSPQVVTNFMKRLVKDTIEFREKNNYSRKDLMQLLIQLRNTGNVNKDDSVWDVQSVKDSQKSMTIEQCAAQAFLFYIAGNETSASTTSFCLYELAQNPEILQRVQDDIASTIEKHNGELTYECIQDMKFLDLCIMETTRKYPGLSILNRECTEDFKIPDSDHVIEKGTAIVISLLGIHRDPNYFPDPLKFDPDRFVEGSGRLNPIAFSPFGEGPRKCIALRLGVMNVKVGIAMLLTKFNISALDKEEIEFDNYSVGLMSKGGINVKITKKL